MRAFHSALALATLIAVWLVVGAEQYEGRELKVKPDVSVHVRGEFSSSVAPVRYWFSGRKGETCRITIKPTGDLDTAGHLFFPESTEGAGGPGGTFFEGPLPKDGPYRIWVEHRAGKSKRFELELRCELPNVP